MLAWRQQFCRESFSQNWIKESLILVVGQFQFGWLGSNEVSPQTLRFLGARKDSTPATLYKVQTGPLPTIESFMVAQASRLCCEQNLFSLTGETPVPRLCGVECCFSRSFMFRLQSSIDPVQKQTHRPPLEIPPVRLVLPCAGTSPPAQSWGCR